MPTETPPRPADACVAGSWDTQDLTSQCDVELDTVTLESQRELRRLAAALRDASSSAEPATS